MNISEFDFHVHTNNSVDSFIMPNKIIKVAKQRCLSGVAITDHATIKGGLSVKKHNKSDLIVIVGAEIKTEIGDITGLFLNEEVQSNEIWRVIDEIRVQDGLVILPHPFRGHDVRKFDKRLLDKIDAIEGYNSRNNKRRNILAQEFANKHDFPVIAGSDAHFFGEVGLARTIMMDVYSEDDIRKCILCGETQIYGKIAPLYYMGGSKVLANVNTGKWNKIPSTLFEITLKGVKKYMGKEPF